MFLKNHHVSGALEIGLKTRIVRNDQKWSIKKNKFTNKTGKALTEACSVKSEALPGTPCQSTGRFNLSGRPHKRALKSHAENSPPPSVFTQF